MNWRKFLIGILVLAFGIECLFPIAGFLFPHKTLELFKVGVSPDTLFLSFVVSWCLLFVAVACGLALRLVVRNNPAGWTLSIALGYWWMGIGLGLFLVHGRVDNLFLDALKGALIAVSAHLSRPKA